MQQLRSRGFALPTVLIASVVLLTVLAVSVTATAAVRTTLKNQYYAQLAQIAGEAGVAYAKSCLTQNENEPLWNDANPLRPNTDCSGSIIGGYSDTVMSSGNLRSKFSVGLPELDADGKAVTIPNTGYVEIIRSSTGAVWRTYTQPTVQAAVVPDLCSGQASSTLGWQNAFVASDNITSQNIEGAIPIALNSTNAVYPGPQYFRKDFSVTQSGDHILDTVAGATQQVFIDGEQIVSPTTGRSTKTVNLDVGCHTIEVRLYNGSLMPSGSELRTVIRREGTSTPVVKTDTTWRTAVGSLVEYTKPNYYQTSQWGAARDLVFYNDSPWTGGPSGWTTYAADTSARWINTDHNFSGTTYPSNQRAYFINNHLWEVNTATEFKFTMACDDDCTLYANGTPIIQTNTWNVTSTTTYVLQPGKYRLALELSNVSGPSGFLFSAWTTTGTVVDESSMSGAWVAANAWYSSPQSLYSYAADFVPEPFVSGTATVDALIVAGGGGGGGNCASCGGAGGGGGGGVLLEQGYPVTVGSIPVVVGAGGAAGPGGSNGIGNGGSNGENSSFGSLIAVGGGGGQAQSGYPGRPGGSGGGGGGGGTPGPGSAGVGVFGQGNVGGSGVASPYGGGGGGGAGARGNNATSGGVSGAGGAGRSVTFAGGTAYYGGGGGGGAYSTYTAGAGGVGGGGNGVNQNVNNGNGYAGQANTGGGGGGAAGLNKGGSGGAGGSGVVIIAYPTGSLTATGGTVSTFGGYTIHRFTSDGTFRITSIN